MSIRFPCNFCGRKLKARDELAGTPLRCPSCGEMLQVPHRQMPGSEPVLAGPDLAETPTKSARAPRSWQSQDDDLDMTPMVDMTFLLLIFFMVTASFSLQKSISLPPPEQQQAGAQGRSIEELDADEDYIVVRVDGENMFWVEDREAASEHEMLVQLREAREQREASGRPPSRMLVLASGDARHERVVAALDAGTAAGMEDVRLATVDDDVL